MQQVDRGSTYVTDAEMQIVLAALRVLTAVAGRHAGPAGRLDLVDLRLLLAIGRNPPIRLGELARLTDMFASVMVSRCHSLADRDLISVDGSGSVSVTTLLGLTVEGRRQISVAVSFRRQALEAILERLPAFAWLEVATVWTEFPPPGAVARWMRRSRRTIGVQTTQA